MLNTLCSVTPVGSATAPSAPPPPHLLHKAAKHRCNFLQLSHALDQGKTYGQYDVIRYSGVAIVGAILWPPPGAEYKWRKMCGKEVF
jgi:hypothetical protein